MGVGECDGVPEGVTERDGVFDAVEVEDGVVVGVDECVVATAATMK